MRFLDSSVIMDMLEGVPEIVEYVETRLLSEYMTVTNLRTK